jgi:5S rRNA maturation endonuclease (ribonuclease M5)
MTIADLKILLAAKTGNEPKASGEGFICRCPAHDDQTASLSFRDDRDGLLLHCHAGCTFEAITAALGIKPAELFHNNGTQSGKGDMNIAAVYPYTDAEGKLLFEVCRLEPKDFRQRRPDPTAKNGYAWNSKGVEQVPYCLPELITAVKAGQTVFVAEGEKDVAALVARGFVATCNAGGAGKWKDNFAQHFNGAKSVVIIADKDKPGRKHAEAIAANVRPKVLSVKVIELPDVAGRTVKDAHDFFEAGGTADQLRQIAAAAAEFAVSVASQPQPGTPQLTQQDPPAPSQSQTEPAERVTGQGLVMLPDEKKIAIVPLFYYAERSRWYAPDSNGGFFNLSDSQAKSFVAEYGFNKKSTDGQGNTAAERALLWKMQNAAVAYAGELAGYPTGCHDNSGGRILVTKSPRLITPTAGHWPTIARLIETMLADGKHSQVIYFFLWLARSYAAFLERMDNPSGFQFRHCPALYIAGPRKCGKSALIDLIITPLFGGRQADPMNYLREPKFNKDLFSAPLLVLDDKGASASLAERRQRGEAMKDLIWKPEQRMEGKGADAIRLRPFWRLVMAGNDDDAGLQVCPALSPSLEDKLLILRAQQAEGLPTTNEENNTWAAAIRAELPAFAHFLLNFEPPAGLILDERTRIANFWHPQIVSALRDLQPEMRLLELIDTFDLIGADAPLWQGSATDFQKAMMGKDTQGLLDRIFINGTSAGRMLTELSQMSPDRVKKTDRDGSSFYRVFAAVKK